ncbi:MAG: 1-acyl-sn-glycerol-3-phosphate acyltransferase [Deltaproteobacteria bacterium]|nr:1-acyl-sn-glycerol-3-phosphate acyltransferase [Deltaproteobacteria bacterium]
MRRALSFLNFVFTTLFLSMVALSVAPFDKGGNKIHKIARLWAKIYMRIGGVTVSINGLDRVHQPPYIFMCNHQSALDIHVLLAALPFNFKFIAKRSLFLIPFFGWALTRAGYISLDRDNPRRALKAIDEAARSIQAGANILLFPEGTRNVDGKLLPFKKGVFSLALKAGVPIVPIGIYGTSALQPEGYQVPLRTGKVVINLGEPITIAGKGTSYKDELAQTVRARIEELRQPGPARTEDK